MHKEKRPAVLGRPLSQDDEYGLGLSQRGPQLGAQWV